MSGCVTILVKHLIFFFLFPIIAINQTIKMNKSNSFATCQLPQTFFRKVLDITLKFDWKIRKMPTEFQIFLMLTWQSMTKLKVCSFFNILIPTKPYLIYQLNLNSFLFFPSFFPLSFFWPKAHYCISMGLRVLLLLWWWNLKSSF